MTRIADVSSLKALTTALALMLIAAPAAAHSLEEMQRRFGDKEPYFQALDRPAPAFSLDDADGREVELADFAGKVVVLHFIYATCPDVCPLHADRIAEVQTMVNRTPMKPHVQFVSVTTDPRNDTAKVLSAYGPAHGLDPTNWSFLTIRANQTETTTRDLAKAYGHKFEVTEDGRQVHGVVTHVIDRQGRWRGNFHGLRFDPTNLVMFVNALVNDHHSTSDPSLWDRIRRIF